MCVCVCVCVCVRACIYMRERAVLDHSRNWQALAGQGTVRIVNNQHN